MSDPVVKARLAIETEGEPQAFREAADSVGELGASASEATPSLDGLLSQLEGLGQSAETSEQAQRAVQDMAEALRDLAEASGIDEQREAVARAIEIWKRLGEEVPEAIEAGTSATREYQATLERLIEIQRDLADPLTQGLGRAEEAFQSLGQSVEGNMFRVSEKLAQARRRIDEYRDALDRARQAGQGVTAGQEQELARLEAKYSEATRAIGRYASTKREANKDIERARDATRAEIGSINDLSDVMSAASPKFRGLASATGQVIDSFRAGWEAGEAFRGMLNALTDGGFDRAVQGMLAMEQAADRLVDGLDRAARSAETLANQRRLFEQLGLEGFTGDVDRNAAALEEHARAAAADRDEVAKLKDEVDKISKSLGVNREELDKQAAALAQSLKTFAEQNRQLSAADLGAIFGPMIQKLLDGYARLRVEVPPALAALASSWNVTTTAAQNAAAKHRQIIDQLVEDITGVPRVSREALNSMANDLLNALDQINLSRLDFAQFERAQAHVRALVDQYTAAGEEIPAALAKVAAQLNVFQSGIDLTAARARAAGLEVSGLDSAIQRAGESTVRATRDLETGRVAIEGIVPPSQEAQISLSDLMARYGEAGRAAARAGEQARQAAEAAAGSAPRLAEAAAGFEEVAGSAAGAGREIAGAGEEIERTVEAVGELSGVRVDLEQPAAEAARLASAIQTIARETLSLLSFFERISLLRPFTGILEQLNQVEATAQVAKGAVAGLVGDAVTSKKGEG